VPPLKSESIAQHIAGVLLLALSLGCQDQTPDSQQSYGPAVGTEYEITVLFKDDSGTTSSKRTQRVVVQASNMLVEGRESVAQFSSESNTSLISYSEHGGLALYMPSESFGTCTTTAGWLEFPATTGDTLHQVLDISGTEDGRSCEANWKACVVETIPGVKVGDRTLTVVKFDAELSVGVEDSIATAYYRQYQILYSDSIRYVVRERITEEIRVDTVVQTIGTTERRLDAIHEP